VFNNEARLDAADTVYFKRQLESIDSIVFQHKYPKYKSRGLLPTQNGVDPDARSYTYRMYNTTGKAKVIGNAADDLPTSNASGAEFSQVIKEIGAAYRYSISEIKAAAKGGFNLDEQEALGARRAIEEQIDEFLALGSTEYNLKGLLTLSGTTAFTSAGAWGTIATADPEAVANDMMGCANAAVEATDEAFNEFTLVLPLALYNIAAQIKLGPDNPMSVLAYVKATSPYIKEVVPWFRTESKAAFSNKHRMCAFPKSAEVVAALVPKELDFMSPELRNLAYVVNGVASCGGVVCRFPKAISYCDITP
jgi:hypothetical protein